MDVKQLNLVLDLVEYCKERAHNIRHIVSYDIEELEDTLSSIEKLLTDELVTQKEVEQTNINAQ